jgi:hypothetical protein
MLASAQRHAADRGMMKTFLFGISAAALALAASGAEAKAPQCRDAKGRIVPCPEKTAPAPAPSGGAACLWLLVNGSLVSCYAI